MHKVLFLDIDGVLNTNDGNEKHQTKLRRGKPIDRKKVKRLGKLIRYTGAKLVLHSGWRFWFDENKLPLRKEAAYLLRLLEKQKLSIYDMTPDLTTEEIRAAKRFSLVKAEEILAWLDAHQEVEVWAVLDDLDLQNERVASRQIRTDPSAGLTREKMWAAEKLLNPPIETFEELYRMLREHDRENRIARPWEDTITVRLTGEYQFNIYDNTREVYLELATQDGQCYHFHPDYRGGIRLYSGCPGAAGVSCGRERRGDKKGKGKRGMLHGMLCPVLGGHVFAAACFHQVSEYERRVDSGHADPCNSAGHHSDKASAEMQKIR